MAHSEARAWWTDVQHLRDGYERTDEARRRADEADLASRRATRERLGVEAEVSTLQAPRRERAEARPAARHGAEQARAPRRGQHAAATADPRERLSDPSAADAPVAARPRGFAEPFLGASASAESPRVAGVPDRGRVKGSGAPDRVTIQIRGRTVPAPTVPRSLEPERRRPRRRPVERVGARPDRVAMWALMMGLLLILVAIGTADGPAVISLTLR